MPRIRDYMIQDNICIFDAQMDASHSAYSARLLQDQENMESRHFWFKTRRDKICRLFEKKVQKEGKILEIGGGTGFIAQQLNKKGFSIEMGDIHFNGLKYAQEKGIKKLYQFDLFKPPFREEFDTICLFDVLEHQKEDKQALECLKTMLKPGGKIVLTVPAHQWLWNRDDQINGHYRRYTKKMLMDLCAECQLKPLHIEYFFIFILPLLFMRTVVNRERSTKVEEKEQLMMQLPLGLNTLCYGLTKLEFSLSRWLPNVVGGSLFLIAEKL